MNRLSHHGHQYIEIPKEHFLFGKSYLDIEYIDVHGGLTYSSDSLIIGENSIIKNSWFIGWDYAHLNDYCGCFNSELNKLAKKWTTSEINEECKKVIDIIKEIK